eukprot:gb/GECG01002615.1/.p1 GENE.gb/GECG01002615.1/~~gb/GECG01002615.1/.p1  ORF type:complete len:204 (+),score=22.71 gb/GECG01002615.1/:1-612(+)
MHFPCQTVASTRRKRKSLEQGSLEGKKHTFSADEDGESEERFTCMKDAFSRQKRNSPEHDSLEGQRDALSTDEDGESEEHSAQYGPWGAQVDSVKSGIADIMHNSQDSSFHFADPFQERSASSTGPKKNPLGEILRVAYDELQGEQFARLRESLYRGVTDPDIDWVWAFKYPRNMKYVLQARCPGIMLTLAVIQIAPCISDPL